MIHIRQFRLPLVYACLCAGAQLLPAQDGVLRLKGDTQGVQLTQTPQGIHSTQAVGPDADIRYHAGNTISLTAGFRTAPGSSFEARVLPQEDLPAPATRAATPVPSAGLDLFPLPADRSVSLRLAMQAGGVVAIEIFDMAMRKVWTHTADSQDLTSLQLDIATDDWPAGTYLVQVRSTRDHQQQKLVIQH